MSRPQLPLIRGNNHLVPDVNLVFEKFPADLAREVIEKRAAQLFALAPRLVPVPVVAVDNFDVDESGCFQRQTVSVCRSQPEIEALLANGSTQKFIAKRYQTTPANLSNWIKKNRIKKPEI